VRLSAFYIGHVTDNVNKQWLVRHMGMHLYICVADTLGSSSRIPSIVVARLLF
jgi:hypothetical protein